MTSRGKRGIPFVRALNKYINRFHGLEYTGTHVRCVFCNIKFFGRDAHGCRQHVQSKRHIANVTRKISYWQFLYDYIFMVTACNIPQYALDNDNFRLFWGKYVSYWKLPSRKQLRNNLPRVNEKIKNLIKSELSKNKIWITIDQSIDGKRKKVLCVLVRPLKKTGPSQPYLLTRQGYSEINSEIVVQQVKDSMRKFGIVRSQVAMLVTDEKSYMLEAGEMLKKHFPNLLHITCLLRAMQSTAETVRTSFPSIDSLLSNTKKIFVKSPKRVKEFQKSCPRIPLPPEPSPETWLEAVAYYNQHYQTIKAFISSLNPQESPAIKTSQKLFSDIEVEVELYEITGKYSIVWESISQLQDSKLSLEEALYIVDNLNSALQIPTDPKGLQISEQFHAVLDKNPDFQQLRCINQCINQDSENQTTEDQHFKYANITSFDVAHTYSKYMQTFSPSCKCLSDATMEGLLMLQLYANSLPSQYQGISSKKKQ